MPNPINPPSNRAFPILPLTVGLGVLMFLCLLKFGTPVSLSQLITRPTSLEEWIYFSWPLEWGAVFVIAIATLAGIIGLTLGKPEARILHDPQWKLRVMQVLFCTPLAWILWQCLASIQSNYLEKSEVVLIHFVLCGLCFLMASKLAALSFSPQDQEAGPSKHLSKMVWAFWTPVTLGLIWLLRSGIEQKFGGLEATRQMLYESPEILKNLPPEYLERIGKNRIFGTYFYPNAFAGAILMVLPAVCGFLVQARKHVRQEGGMRWVLPLVAMALTLTGLGCLVWSGSKAGWLIAMAQVGVLWLLAPTPGKLKWGALGLGILVGLAAFFIQYSDFFAKGATSVGARFGYWAAAVEEWKAHPIMGSGPGTFDIYYAERKEPEWEMTRLAHNDYLQQASDSGTAGALTYTLWIAWILFMYFRKNRLWKRPLALGVWLGALGWGLQSFVEFGLYVPGIAWPAFIWMGLLYGDLSKSQPNSESSQSETPTH